MRFVPILFLATALSVLTCHGEPAPRTFLQTGYGFKLALTDDWDALPPGVLKEIEGRALKIRKDWTHPAIHGGYWMTNAFGYTFPPYVLVRAVEPGYPLDEQTIRDEWNEKGLVAEGIEVDKSVLDTNLNAFVGRGKLTIQQIPAVVSVAVFPTRLGAIKIVGYAAQTDLERHPELFAEFLRGLRIDRENEPGWKASKQGLWLGLGSIALVVLVLWRAKPVEK